MSIFSEQQYYIMLLDIANRIPDMTLCALSFLHLKEDGFPYEVTEDSISMTIDEKTFVVPKSAFLGFMAEDDLSSIFIANETEEELPQQNEVLDEDNMGIEGLAIEPTLSEEQIKDVPMVEDTSEAIEEVIEEVVEESVEEVPLAPPSFSKFDIPTDAVTTLPNEKTGEVNTEELRVIPMVEKYPFIEQMSTHYTDCVYKLFRIGVHHKDSFLREEMFFYVYPLILKENDPSTEIVAYCFWKGKGYATSSYDGKNNAVQFNVGDYEFLVRGTFENGKFDASIMTSGISATSGDVLDVITSFKNDIHSGSINSQNGHIKFKYVGYETLSEKMHEGIIEVFPTDFNTNSFLVVRRIEDFIDYYFTDQQPNIYIQLEDEMDELICYWEDGVMKCDMVLSDK